MIWNRNFTEELTDLAEDQKDCHARMNLERAKLKERIAAQPDIVYCRECKKRYTRICPMARGRQIEAKFCSYGEREEEK